MSADNYIGYYKDETEEEKRWVVGHGFASPQMEDCQYRATPQHFFDTEGEAAAMAHEICSQEDIVEYGVQCEEPILKEPEYCKHCYVCVHDRGLKDEHVEHCDKCKEPLLDGMVLSNRGKLCRSCNYKIEAEEREKQRKEELQIYLKSEEFEEDYEAVTKLLAEDDKEGLVEFLSRDVQARAREAARRIKA